MSVDFIRDFKVLLIRVCMHAAIGVVTRLLIAVRRRDIVWM